METGEHRDFNKDAAQWDADPGRVKLAHEVADAIIREAKPSRNMDALDFGCGTGLVTLKLQPLVRTILGADSSQGMLDILEEKIRTRGIANARTCLVDYENRDCIEGRGFHLLVSSMTLHHVPDTAGLFKQWHELLLPGGLLCFADLDAEDGSFHRDNTGVFHKGFDRKHLKELLLSAGFHDVHAATATTMTMDAEKNGKKEFPVFLISAKK
jgi:ubiquinone/menaquinone biosynthesis C-methylase UbiE